MRHQSVLSCWLIFIVAFLSTTQRVDAFGKLRPAVDIDEAAEDISDGNEAIPMTPEAIAERDEHMTLAGQVMPIIKRFFITGEKARDIFRALQAAVSLNEFFLIGLVGWAWFPLNKALFDLKEQRKANTAPVEVGDENDKTAEAAAAKTEVKKFEEGTYWYQSAKHISQAARIGAFIYAVDCFAVILNTIGFRYKQQAGFSNKAAHISFSVWVALRVGELKHWLLRKAFHKERNQLGKVQVYDSILNFIIGAVTFGHVLDLFDINIGVALAILLSIGGVGTLVMSLASKDIATELVSGLAVSASDRFIPGEEIFLGDGTAGFINRMGLLYTDVRGYDEVVTRIPNSHLSGQRATNLSRAAPKSQVKQILRFSYKDVKKMPAVVKAIKEEISAACPTLINDGSRPFRAHWRNFSQDHLEVVVDAHFNTRPTGDVYYDLRQEVLEAIARAAERVGVEFTLPASICKTERA